MRDPISPSHNDSSDYKYGEIIDSMLMRRVTTEALCFTGRFDASALHIAHALKQTEIQKSYNKAREKPIDEYLVCLSSFVKKRVENHFLSIKFQFRLHMTRLLVSLIKMGSRKQATVK